MRRNNQTRSKRKTSFRRLELILFGKKKDDKKDDEDRKSPLDLLLDVAGIPKCIVTEFFTIPVRITNLEVVKNDAKPKDENLQFVEPVFSVCR